jgi:hypothetical protein
MLRVEQAELVPVAALGVLLLVASLTAAASWAADKSLSVQEACARLDSGWGLHNRLVSAWQGVGRWPDDPPNRSLPLRWRPESCLMPLGLSLSLLLLAARLPLPPGKASPDYRRATPPDWQSMQAFTDEMEEQQWVEEETVRLIREELADLREKPMNSWYEPSTLEATDQLRNRLRQDSARLMQGMEQTSSLLSLAEQGRSMLSDSQQQQMQELFQQLRQQMAEGGLPRMVLA